MEQLHIPVVGFLNRVAAVAPRRHCSALVEPQILSLDDTLSL
ncbi:hypothetical protein F442_19812 [Phytophthora nicotianae P10297]|uniref:Uncharacterized protein n=3 Tax=Phytophthora nicotianae TaxID=4792 RepID=V9E2U8_PHYNI|nr:hypothetical protein F443_20003 [Phytophthora nicotianae P1569]ETO62063.1 hypothetical protein F444_20007 [Phytophthora nicotianae P1976]ETP31303.1 hypothetical protein F442_19812 [Phytophthora nicotianae P10297]